MIIPEFIAKLLLNKEEQNAQLDVKLTTNSVLLRKRHAEWTTEDMFSVFNKQGRYKKIDDRGLRSMNIIQPTVQANTSAVMTAEPKVTIEPRFAKDSKTEMAAEVCRAIRDLKTAEQWTQTLQEQLAMEPQIAPGCFINVSWNPYAKKKYSIDEWGEDEMSVGGRAVCVSCGYEMSGVVGADSIPCEHCGEEAQVIEEPQVEKVDVQKDVKTYKNGDTQTKVVPASEWIIDPIGTQGGNLSKAKWGINRYWIPKGELKAEYENAEAPIPESFPLKWQYALNMGMSSPDQIRDFSEFAEIKDVYLTPEAYDLEEVEADFILKDGSKARFHAPKGKKLSEAKFNGKPFEGPLCFRTVGQTIIDVFPCEFREENIYISMNANSTMFWGTFLTKMLPLQDIVNQMLTIQVRHTSRNARTTKILNSGTFDPEDVEKDVVLTKDPLPFDVPINNTYGMIPAATLSSAPMELVGLMMQIKGEVGGVTPAMQGASSPSEPYAAQRQQKEQSLGQLTPFLRSIAIGKVQWTVQQLKQCQKNYTEEDFDFLLKLNGEWDEEYIDAFLKCDLDCDVIFDYEAGSESPRNLLDRELALRQFMQDLGLLAQLTGMPVDQATADEVLLRIKQFTQVDVDIKNTEAELRLADARYDKIVSLIEGMESTGDPTADAVIAQTIIQIPDLIPSQFEDASTEVEFYKDKITKELSNDEPNFILVSALEGMIIQHTEAATRTAQMAMQAEMAAQQPAMEAEQQQAEAQMAQEQALQSQQMQMEQAKNEQAMANEQAKMEFEREKMGLERENKMMDAGLAMVQAEHAQKIAPKEKNGKK